MTQKSILRPWNPAASELTPTICIPISVADDARKFPAEPFSLRQIFQSFNPLKYCIFHRCLFSSSATIDNNYSMEAVGAGASILTFITVAFSVTKSIHEALSSIKDGPQILRFLVDEIFQLESILQRLSQLEGLAKKCKDDLTAFDSQLKTLDVSGSDGRRGRLWRKLRLCFSEKDLDQIRHVVRGHVQHLTVRLNLIQVQHGSFTATQSTQILSLLQQLKQDVAELQNSNSTTIGTEEHSPFTPARIMEVNDDEMDYSPDPSLDESINRLMRLLEKKPCVVESDDSEELLEDLAHLLECVQKDAEAADSEGACQNCSENVSKELKLMTSIILSAPSTMINGNGTKRLWKPIPKQFIISQERKRKTVEGEDGVITVTTAKRHRKYLSQIEQRGPDNNEPRRDFLAKLTYTSKSNKKMLILSVNQGQNFLNSFTSMLPCITICNIIPKNSLVFETARSGSVQDLLQLIEGGEANIHDHDTKGWSLLHHSVGNLPVLKFLIEQGLDVDEVAYRPYNNLQTTPSHIALDSDDSRGTYEALLHAGADMTLEVSGPVTVIQTLASHDSEMSRIRMEQTFHTSPFVYTDPSTTQDRDLIPWICAECYTLMDSESGQAFQQIQFLIKQGYNVNGNIWGQGCLHHLMSKEYLWLEYLVDYLKLLILVIEHGAPVYATDAYGYQASHYAYNATCEACYLFCPSAKGDLWDAALSYAGYDIVEIRRDYPRIARYTPSYTREDFEKLWHGRERECPYWDDQPWPSEERPRYLQPSTKGKLCNWCESCAGENYECLRCGVCLSSMDFFCDDHHHVHGISCPREQIAAWDRKYEDDDNEYWELVPLSESESESVISSSEGSEDGGALLKDRLEDEFSDASEKDVS
ncbi:hypothetical protein FBEOM_2519 [Fusarium beomiforme]|uniref:Azaphilone pigments biosynthesis cluster protein L N-terminal domain-containing protein n=1 Tax=Fusarium beomiforme TaxID=44412 RepID=A0A9P5ARM9_9HYPO|nr:hypothetical protein FBEOM_2519 [Fusarium beomiforme]